MKISKPVIFALVFAVGIILYLFVFSGKKTPPAPAPKPQASQAQPQGAATAVPGAPQAASPGAPQPATGAAEPKLRTQIYAKLNDATWGRDPFGFPGYVEGERSKQQSTGSARLVAIIAGRNGKVAIFGDEVVKKGDMIG
ncbi:MAG: hypothetical protein NTX36_06940, partial [Proteobacteria bacterium]|nr:hypothetical protein [Pseudomonadota bacterium]